MSDPVAKFWNKQSPAFTAADGSRGSYHQEFAETLNMRLAGDVLCVGGLYQNVDLGRDRRSISVVDISIQMLRTYASRGVKVVCGDARLLPLEPATVDHVVFPLVLHHITDGVAQNSRENVAACFRESLRVLRPGGTVWAIEILVSAPVYWAELTFAPLTNSLLAARGIPLVIFHSRQFYESQLADAGFSNVSVTQGHAAQECWYALVRPVIGLDLRVPKIMVPVKYALLRALKPFESHAR